MTLDAASTGFKNQGQFIAALHVSHNLGIPLPLKSDMVTGHEPRSIDSGFEETADARAKQKGQAQATSDLRREET
jgi:hypothetical protein